VLHDVARVGLADLRLHRLGEDDAGVGEVEVQRETLPDHAGDAGVVGGLELQRLDEDARGDAFEGGAVLGGIPEELALLRVEVLAQTGVVEDPNTPFFLRGVAPAHGPEGGRGHHRDRGPGQRVAPGAHREGGAEERERSGEGGVGHQHVAEAPAELETPFLKAHPHDLPLAGHRHHAPGAALESAPAQALELAAAGRFAEEAVFLAPPGAFAGARHPASCAQ
jgi:hypothetical protein